MKSFLTKLTTAALSLAALLITGSAWAAATAPVAVWDGFSGEDLTRKAGNNVLKLDLNGNEVNADGSVTVSDNGVSFLIYDSTGTTVQKWQGLSVMALVSNCPAIDYPSLIALHCQNGTASLRNIVGLSALSDGKVRELWGGSTYVANSGGSSSSVAGDVPAGDSKVTIGVSWKRGGTAANRLLISNGHNYTTGLSSSQAACDLDGAYIGGYELDKGHYGDVKNWTRLGDSVIATGMKIHAIVVFNDEITSATATAFSMNKWIGGGDNNWSTAANWSKGTVPVSGDAAIIPAGAVVTVDGVIASGVTVYGAGTVVYDNKLPGNEKTSYQATTWTGTVWIKNLATSAQRQVNEFGNVNSTVKFTNVVGWMNTCSFAGTFELEDGPNGEVAWTQDNGGNGQSYTFAKVKGSGKYYAKWNKTASTATIYLVDASEYSGSIQLDNGALGIMIGSNADCQKSKITVAADSTVQIAAGKTWTADGGIVINGTVVAGVSATAPFVSTVTGSGEIVFDGAGSTANTMPAAINGKLGGDWSGVVTLRNFGANNGKQINLANFGKKVKLNGIDGYLSIYSNGSYDGELILEDYVKSDNTVQYAWNQNNGGSGNYVTIAKLSGAGTLNGNAGATQWFRFTDGSEFRGTINFPNTNTDATKKRSVVFGAVNGVAGTLVVEAGQTITIADGKTWTFPVGATIYGTLVCEGTLVGATTFGAGSTMDLSARSLDDDPFVTGNLTIDANTTFRFPADFLPTSESAPSSFRLCSGTLTGAVNGKRVVAFGDTVKLVDMAFADDGSVTYVEINESSWTGGSGTDTNWSTDANWDPTGKPTADADVKIAAEDDDVAIALDEDTASLASLTFSGSHDITFSGTGAITAETIDFTYLTGKVVVGADGLALNGTISGTMTVDPSAVPVDTVFLKGTAIAAANVSFVNVPAGIGVVKTDAGYKTVDAISLLRYGYAFEDNVNKEEAATSSISIGDVSTYEAGVKTRALAFRNGKNYGNDFGFGGGDFTIFAVVKAPVDANKCIFSVGGAKGTAGMLGLRTAGANSVAVFTKDGADLITAAVEDSATMFHYYALTYDSVAHTIALSVDGGAFGEPVAYTSGTGTQFQFGGVNAGGTSGKTDNATNGAIDEFQLYTAKLTVEQIQTLGAAFDPNTWKGANGGAWATASNWSYNEVPAAGESVIIPTGDAAAAYSIDFAGAEVSLGSVKVTGAATNFEFANGEVSMAALNSAVDIQVGADDTLVFSNRTASITLAANKAIKGSGRVVMVGHGITGVSDLLDTAAFPGCKDADNWTGTLEVRDWHGEDDANHSKFGDDLGNINSVICLNGFKGYVYAKDFAQVKAYEIGEDGVEFVGQFSKGNIGFVGDLIGSGDLKLSLTGNDAKNGYLRFVGDSSAYTGSFSFAGNNAFPISLIPSTDTQMPLAEFSQRMIILAVEAGAWTVNGDVEVIAGASFNDAKKPTVNGKIKFDSAVTVTLAEAIPAEGALIINDTTLKPGMVYTAPIAGTAGGVEIEAGYHPVATEEGVVVKLAEVAEWNDETILIDGVKTIDSATVVGACTVKGEGAGAKATISSISVAENASLTLDGVTVEVEDLNVFPQAIKLVNGARLVLNDTMTMLQLAANETLEMEAGTQYSIYNVPNFASGAMLKIKNAANLVAGNYLLIDWKNWPNPDLLKYGQLNLQLEGFEGDASHIRLVYEPYKIWLQVMSAEQIVRKPITIECIGDSITHGLNNAGGSGKNYRIPLFNKLSLAGYNVKTVGYWSNSGVGDGSIDPSGQNVKDWNPDWLWHSGKGSARAGALNGQAAVKDGWSNMIDIGGAPDVVLLHIGINDMLSNQGGENDLNGVATYEYITNMVTEILRTRPDVKLVMSAPMCNSFGHSQQTATYPDEQGKNDKNHQFCEPCHEMCLNFFNQVKAGEWLAEIPGAADRLFYAKNYENIMPSWYDTSKLYLNDGSDHCHPNWLGHDIMAEDWFEQITNAFPLVDGPFNIGRAEKGTYDETNLGAENNVPAEYLNGFVKARQLNNAAFKTMHFTVGADVPYDYTNENIKADTEITKVGYFVEYVRATETTNLHRYVWVDMDAFGKQEVKTLAEVGIPTKGNQQAVVSSLHVYGNHPGVYNIDAGDNTVTGFVEFSPYSYGATGSSIAGAPAHRYSYDWNDTLSETDVFGTMQVHRKFATPELKREGQVVFAYNGWTRTDATYTTFGIGNFGQSFTTSSSLDWTNLETIDTCNTSGYTLMNIEIWVKPAIEPVAKIGDKTYETIEAALADAKSGETVSVLQDAQLASLTVPNGVTLDLNGKAVQAAAIDNKGTIVIYDAATAVAFVGNDIAGTIKFGATITITCGDIGGFPPEYAKIQVYQFPQDGTLQIVPPTDMGEATLNLTLPKGGFAADMIGLEAKKVLNVTWTERDEDGNNLFALAGEICRGSRVDTVLTVSDLGKAVIQGPIIVGADSTNPNIDYTTYPNGIATLQLLGSIKIIDATFEEAYIKLIPGRGELITRFTVKDTGLVKTEDGAVLKESTQTIKEGVTLYYTTAEWIEPSATVKTVTSEGLDGAATFTVGDAAPHYSDWNADFILTADQDFAKEDIDLVAVIDNEQVPLSLTADYTAGEEVSVMDALRVAIQMESFNVSYADMVNMNSFTCGVKNNSLKTDTTFTIKLVLSNGTTTKNLAATEGIEVKAKGGIIPTEQGTVDITGEGEDAVAKITPAANVTKLDITVPVGFSGKYEIPVSITEITGVEINQLIIKSGGADIAPACKIENGAILLDETKSVMVDGEQIPVKPVLSDADDEVKPLVVGDTTSVGVKAIPGLTYSLVRSETIGGDTTDVDSATATGARVTLTDTFAEEKGGKPASAFYVIRVTK